MFQVKPLTKKVMKNYLINTLKNGLISTINLAIGLIALYSASFFFLFLFISEKIRNAPDPLLEKDFSDWQDKVQQLPHLLRSFIQNEKPDNGNKIDILPEGL